MGISRFFKVLKNDSNNFIYLFKDNKYYNIINEIQIIDYNILDEIDTLYMDFQSFINYVIKKYKDIINNLLKILIYKKNEIINNLINNNNFNEFIKYKNNKINKKKTFKFIKKLNDEFIFKKVLEELNIIIFFIKNLKEINIYFDGIPLYAKIREQMFRKIASIVNKLIVNDLQKKYLKLNKLDKIYEKYKYDFDNSKVTFTKPFLVNIREYLEVNLKSKFKHININIEEINIEGESEHKILEDIKKNKTNKKILIFSPDADTILIASYLQILKKNIYIIKIDDLATQKNNWTFDFNLIDIKKFNLYIINKLKCEYDENKIIDILFIFNFLGCDFIPKIDSINIKNALNYKIKYNDYNLLFEYYIQNNLYLLNKVNNKYIINYDNLFSYIKLFTKNEEERFYASRSFRAPIIPLNKISHIDNIEYYFLNKLIENGYILKNKKKSSKNLTYIIENNNLKVNTKYYNIINLFKFKITNYNDKDMVKNYLESFQYIIDLYFNGEIKNKFWYYKYNIAPTLTDIINLSNNIIIKQTNITLPFFNKDEYILYKKTQLDIFLKKLLPHNSINYYNIHNIYDCLNVAFLDRCHYKTNINHEYNFIDPIIFLYNVRK